MNFRVLATVGTEPEALPGAFEAELEAVEFCRAYVDRHRDWRGNLLIKRLPMSNSARRYGAYWSTSCPDTVRWFCSADEMKRRLSLPEVDLPWQ